MNHYLIISSEFPPGPGGIGKHAYSLAKSLVANDSKVSVICDMDYATEAEITAFVEGHKAIMNIHRIARRGAYTYTDRIVSAINAVKGNKFTKVIVTGKFSMWTGGILKLRFGKKVIVEGFIHGSEARQPSKIQRIIFNRCLRLIDKVWCVSGYTKSLLPKDEKILRKTDIIPNGLNIEDWPQSSQKTNLLNWAGNPRLLTVGSISLRKGQHCVIKALPGIIKKYPNAHYHIVGRANNTSYITKLAEGLGVADHITIHGILNPDELIEAYQCADIFCMLSENQPNGEIEGFGIAILEANVMGIPAIGSKGCGIEDAIKSGFNGYLVDSENSSDILRAIDLILNDNADRLRERCIDWARQHDWHLLAKKLQ